MSSPPVLLVHGFASSYQRNWKETGWVDLLHEGGREVIELDLPGHGRAEKPHDPAAYADLENAVVAALPEHGQVDAVGFSLGAGLLLAAAVRHPDRFAHVVLAGVGEGLFRSSDPEPLARAVERGVAADDDSVAAQAFARFSTAPGNDPRALAAVLRRPTRPLDRAALASVCLPVLVVVGDRDFAGPGAGLVAAFPDARLVTLAGADHFATPKDVRFLDAGLDFLGISF